MMSTPSSSLSAPPRSLSSGMLSEALLSSQDPAALTPTTGTVLTGGIRKLSGTEDDDEMLVLDNGGSTPNDVRHFPPSPSPSQQQQPHPYLLSASLSVLGTERGRRRSAAVPISQLDRSPHKLGQDEERALMEYRESLMYSRIVDFHQSRRQSLQMLSEKPEEDDDTTAVKLPLLLRPRAHHHQFHGSLGVVLSKPPPRRPLTLSAAEANLLFPLRGDDDPSSSSRNNNVDDDDDDEDDGSDHHHHEEVFELDL